MACCRSMIFQTKPPAGTKSTSLLLLPKVLMLPRVMLVFRSCRAQGHPKRACVPRGCFGQLASTRHSRRISDRNPSFSHPSFTLLISIHSDIRVPLKDWPQPLAGRRPWPAGEAFLTCRCKCFIRSSCSAATLHSIPTTRLQRSSVLRPRSCTPLLHCIYAPCARVLAPQAYSAELWEYAPSTLLARDLK